MYLVDTNIFLHILLKKDKYKQSSEFLKSNYEFFITDFSIYSICILLSKLKEFHLLKTFISDILSSEFITIISIEPEEIQEIIKIEKKYNLDFDDAYQYYNSTKLNLIIVSYDNDFERIPEGAKKPEEII